MLAPKQDGAYGDAHTTAMVLLAAAAALLLPFSTTAPLTAKIATGVVELVIGIAIGTLLSGVAARSVLLASPAGYPAADELYDQPRSASDFN